jgi:hypothetical protein
LILKFISPEKNHTEHRVISDHEFCQVREDLKTGQRGLFANHNFDKGQVLVKFNASKMQDFPDHLTVQLGLNSHIHLIPDYLQYVNHGCSPNVLFNTNTMEFESVSPIQKGDELRFFYPATEWSMAQPFNCNCGSANCIGQITGAAFTPIEILKKYKLTDFVRSMLESR